MNKGPWQIESSREVYKDDFINVKVDEVIGPDRKPRTYSTVDLKPGVAVLAIDAENQVYLTKQFRYALGKDSIEVVCGGIDAGADPLTSAQKELRQEIGIEAAQWFEVGTVDMDTSVIHCPIHLFVARELTRVGASPEGTEDIRYLTVPLQEAVNMVMNSQITQSASCVVILRHHCQSLD